MVEGHPRDDLQSRDSGRVPGETDRSLAAGPRDAVDGRERNALSPIVVDASAKINLYLKVLGRRPDGYHLIESVAQTISLCDTLTLEEQPEGIDIEVDHPSLPSGPDNLVWRAAASLPRPGRGNRGARIRLVKRIPIGAGLGGGSSDAAATLAGLRRLWRLDLSERDLVPIAAAIGSDVPFFLTGGTARLTGTGTEVEGLPDASGYDLLVVFPGVALSTEEVYTGSGTPLTSALKISSMERFHRNLTGNLELEVERLVRAGNDLEPSASRLCPAVGEIRGRLLAAGAVAAAMTGSGSAVFGVFRNPAAVDRASAEEKAAGFTVMRCSPLSRQEHRRRLRLD